MFYFCYIFVGFWRVSIGGISVLRRTTKVLRMNPVV